MECIASYPVTEEVLRPYIGKPVFGVTHFGDQFYGIVHACRDGNIYINPIQREAAIPAAAIRRAKKQLSHHPKTKQRSVRIKTLPKVAERHAGKANISQFGLGFGFGLGAGVGFALPLLAIGALFTAPFLI